MKKDVKKLIKETAQKIFLTRGLDKISMRNIAAEIGYSPTTIYLYYKNKDELLRDILTDYNSDFDSQMAKLILQDKEIIAKLKDFLILYIMNGLDFPDMFKLLTDYFFNQKDRVQESTENTKYLMLKGFVNNLIESNIFAKGNPDFIARSLWMHCFGVTAIIVHKPEMINADVHEFIDFSITTLINSFKINNYKLD